MQAMVPSMDVCCELKKFPILFEHYQEQYENEGTSFLSFIDTHYGGKQDAKDHQDEHDGNLPFHGQHQCCHCYIFIAPLLGQTEINPSYFSQGSGSSIYNFSVCSVYPASPFQPPKA
jgi:hypothetical protein